MKAQEYVVNYYNHYDEEGRLLSRHGQVEFLTTMHYIEKYLQPGMRILEIGAGTGRYSHALARKGYEVDAVELVEKNIEIFRKNTQEGESITIRQGDALDLCDYPDNTYDITLLLGPMYHMFTEEERLQVLSEALRVTKKGGIVYAAYCMADASIISFGFVKGQIHKVIEKNMMTADTFEIIDNPWDVFALYRKRDIEALRSHFDVEPMHFIASDGCTNHMRDVVDQMDEETYAIYLRYHLATCEREDLVGASYHTLDVFRK